MTSSVAYLRVSEHGGRTRVHRAYAQSPQRWTLARAGEDGWAEASHQFLGDGAFSGDVSRTRIDAGPRARLAVRGVTAMPLRRGRASLSAVRLIARAGSSLIYLPGAVVPHAGSSHSASLLISAEEGAAVFALAILVPGRIGMGESALFDRLRFRTRAMYGGRLALGDDVEVDAEDLHRLGSMGESGAFLSAICLGPWETAFAPLANARCEGGTVAHSRLRLGGVAVRGVFPTLGSAQAYGTALERAARSARSHP